MASEDFLQQIERIAERIAELESGGDSAMHDAARELVEGVLEFHRVALGRLLSSLAGQSECFQETLATVARENPLVAHLLLLHDLHPTDLQQRVATALEHIQPLLPVPGTVTEILEASQELVRIDFFAGTNDPAACIAIQRMLEEALLSAVPDVAAVECRAVFPSNSPRSTSLPILNARV